MQIHRKRAISVLGRYGNSVKRETFVNTNGVPTAAGSVYFDERLERYVGLVSPGAKRRRFYGPRGERRVVAKIGVEERMRPFLERTAASIDSL